MMKHAIAVCMAFVCHFGSLAAGERHPYASDTPMLSPVRFALPDTSGTWHIAFTPDGKSVYFLEGGDTTEIVKYSDYINGAWSIPRLAPFSGKYRIETPSISPDGKKFFFVLPINIDQRGDQTKMYQMDMTDTGWSAPRMIDTTVYNSTFVNCPHAAANGTLYYTAFRDGSPRIYRSTFEDGKYAAAEKVGAEIGNTWIFDFTIDPGENFIILEQNYNLYISFNVHGSWTPPKNIGFGVNTPEYEGRPCISPDGTYLFFTRGGLHGEHMSHYQIDLKPIIDSLQKQKGDTMNLAKGKRVFVSSTENPTHTGENAVDGTSGTRWSSEFEDPQWFMVDLGGEEMVGSFSIYWESAAERYSIEVSSDLSIWEKIYSTDNGCGGLEEISVDPVRTRFIRLALTKRSTPYGYSIFNFGAYSPIDPRQERRK